MNALLILKLCDGVARQSVPEHVLDHAAVRRCVRAVHGTHLPAAGSSQGDAAVRAYAAVGLYVFVR